MLPTAAATTGEIAQATARILLEIEAVLFRPDDPFILTSGRASPVYVDCRNIISFPRPRAPLMDFARDTIQRAAGRESIDSTRPEEARAGNGCYTTSHYRRAPHR